MNKTLELRYKGPAEVEETSEGLIVRGVVNQPGSWSEPLPAADGKTFVERVMPNVFDNALSRGNNVKFLDRHNKDKILASTKAGSLTLEEKNGELVMEARIAPTSYGVDAYTLIKTGEMAQMSFGMAVLDDVWENDGGTLKRSITDLYLSEISCVPDPAYSQSVIEARSSEITPVEVPNIEERDYSNMNDKKALNEEKQELLAKLDTFTTIEEQRSLEPKEEARQQSIVNQVNQINEQIKALESKNKNIKKEEVRNMEQLTKTQEEIRAVEQYIRKQDGEELRTMQTTGAGALTIPTTLHGEIIERLYEVAPLFGKARQFTPVNGYLDILKENVLGDAAFMGELVNITPQDFTMQKVTLDQKRVTSAIELSNHLINDAGVDVVSYSKNALARRVGQLLDRKIISGRKSQNEFEGLQSAVAINDAVTAASATAVTIDELYALYLSLNPEYIPGAVWVMNRNTFNQIAKLKNSKTDEFYLARDVAEKGPVYKLFGQPVLINDACVDMVTGSRPIFFGNLSEGYAVMVKQGLTLNHVTQDSAQALKGSQLLVLEAYMDGKLINEKAFVALRMSGVPVVYPA